MCGTRILFGLVVLMVAGWKVVPAAESAASGALGQRYVLLEFLDPAAGHEAEFEVWWPFHMKAMLALTSSTSAERYQGASSQLRRPSAVSLPGHMAVYFISTDDLAGVERFVKTESLSFSPSVDLKTARMFLYRELKWWKASGPKPEGDNYRHLVFVNSRSGRDEELNQWYDTVHANDILAVQGVIEFQRFSLVETVLGSGEAPPKYLSMMDFKTNEVEAFSARLDQAGARSPNPDAFDRSSAWRQLYRQAGQPMRNRSGTQTYRTTFTALAPGQPGVLYEPLTPGPKAQIAVFAMHDNGDYLSSHPGDPCGELASRGYRVLCANSTTSKSGFFSDDDIDKLLLNVKAGVAYLRTLPQIKSVVLFGHSGGGEMMAAYQNIAENGIKVCQGLEKIVKCPGSLAGMPAADGVMLIDSVFGGPFSTLISLDPAVADEDNGQALNPEVDMFNPQNGFDSRGSVYSDEFKARFFSAEGARMNNLIAKAQARLKLIEAGKGRFKDDEPFVIPGAWGVTNKLNAQDLTLQAHTRNAWPLLHSDGTVTTEIIHSVRTPRFTESSSPSLEHGAITTTVRRFLSTWAIRTTADFRYDATSVHGVDWASSYADEVDSIQGITKPLLQMGMTGSYEFFASENVREYARSADKTLAYVEGATHAFTPCNECALAKRLPENYYGDTVKTLYDFIDGWLSKPGRFLAESTQ